MEGFIYESKVMWSQVDANMHLRHSAYADFAAQARLELLDSLGVGVQVFAQHRIGPVLFREELIYHKEIKLNDTIRITCVLSKLSDDTSRWSFVQQLHRGDGALAATINVDGAWMDIHKRKLAELPEEIRQLFLSIYQQQKI